MLERLVHLGGGSGRWGEEPSELYPWHSSLSISYFFLVGLVYASFVKLLLVATSIGEVRGVVSCEAMVAREVLTRAHI